MKMYQFNVTKLQNKNELIYQIQLEIPTEYHTIAYKMLLVMDDIVKDSMKRGKGEIEIIIEYNNFITFCSEKLSKSKDIIKMVTDYFISFDLMEQKDGDFNLLDVLFNGEIIRSDGTIYESESFEKMFKKFLDSQDDKDDAKYQKDYTLNMKILSKPQKAIPLLADAVFNTSEKEQKIAKIIAIKILSSYFKFDSMHLNISSDDINCGIKLLSNNIDNFSQTVAILNEFVKRRIIFDLESNTDPEMHSFTTKLTL